MNKIQELNQQIKVLQEQIKELQKSFPITFYDKDPSIWNQAKKDYLNKYGFAKSIYFFFSKKVLDWFFNGLVFTLLMKLFNLIKNKLF